MSKDDVAPDVRLLWKRESRARKSYICDACNDPIEIGARYTSVGLVEDGIFRHLHEHFAAYHYPSGCPGIGARDRSEAEAQFAADEARYFPTHEEVKP